MGPEFRRIMPTRPDAVVAVVLRQDRVLVIKRGSDVRNPDIWAPPTGKIEKGEPQADAVVREVREEVGLEVTPIRKVWQCVSADGTHNLHWWLSRYEHGDLRLAPREVQEASWWTPEQFALTAATFDTDREFFASVFPSIDGSPGF